MNCLTHNWIPFCLKGLSTRLIRKGWTEMCEWSFPQLDKGLHRYVYIVTSVLDTSSIALHRCSSEVDLMSPYWLAYTEKAAKWPNFHETPKLKDMLYGNSLDHYSIPYLRGLCRARILPVAGKKSDLIARLEAYQVTVEENEEFVGVENQLNDEDDDNIAGEAEDVLDNLVVFEEADSNAVADPVGELELEADTPEETDDLYEIEKFIKYIEDDDEMVVKWRGYSGRHNTHEPCDKLRVDLGVRQFDIFCRQLEELYKEKPVKKRKRA